MVRLPPSSGRLRSGAGARSPCASARSTPRSGSFWISPYASSATSATSTQTIASGTGDNALRTASQNHRGRPVAAPYRCCPLRRRVVHVDAEDVRVAECEGALGLHGGRLALFLLLASGLVAVVLGTARLLGLGRRRTGGLRLLM